MYSLLIQIHIFNHRREANFLLHILNESNTSSIAFAIANYHTATSFNSIEKESDVPFIGLAAYSIIWRCEESS
jgi:hypothetical protein